MNRVQAKHKQNGMDGGKQNERGKQNVERGQELDEGSGHGRQRVDTAGTQKAC